MKRLNLISMGTIGIVAVFTASCSKDEFPTKCRIKEVKQGNNITAQAYYDGKNRVERFTTYDQVTQIVDNDFHVYRNNEGKIDSAYVFDETNELVGKYRLIYNVSGNIGRIDVLTDDNDDGIYTIDQYYEMVYNTAQDVETIRRFNSGGSETAEYSFEWSNGNIVTFNNDGPRLEFTYDDKLSLYTGVGKDVLFLNPQLLPLIMSKNNPLKIQQYNLLNQPEFTIDFSYQYNEHDLPVQSTAVQGNNTTVTNYWYTCD